MGLKALFESKDEVEPKALLPDLMAVGGVAVGGGAAAGEGTVDADAPAPIASPPRASPEDIIEQAFYQTFDWHLIGMHQVIAISFPCALFCLHLTSSHPNRASVATKSFLSQSQLRPTCTPMCLAIPPRASRPSSTLSTPASPSCLST